MIDLMINQVFAYIGLAFRIFGKGMVLFLNYINRPKDEPFNSEDEEVQA